MGVITISRQMGSEGTYVGKKLAKDLGLRYVDKQELGKIMREYGFSYFDEVYDSKPNFWERFDRQRGSTVDFLIRAMNAVAKADDVVMLGRGGFGLFQGYTDVLNVRIQAPFDLRVDRKMKEHGLKRPEGEELLRKYDQIRTSFIESDLNFNANDASMYDIVLNTDFIKADDAVPCIASAYASLMKNKRFGIDRSVRSIEVEPLLFKHVEKMLETV
ncbi:MAG TPA: cytidylate kinase-like family protein [Sphaerochaeta sp.]|jgi:cytidylate kinase|nr:cytidylate kinase-like family protein [Sphaerochaeta sp.]